MPSTVDEKKTKIVFCKKYKKRSEHKTVKFDFLGFSFQPRATAMKTGQMFLGHDYAIGQSNKSRILEEIKLTQFQWWTNRIIEQIAEFFESKIIGWVNYYGKFR